LKKEGSKDILYTIDGQWSDGFVVKEGKTKKEVRGWLILIYLLIYFPKRKTY